MTTEETPVPCNALSTSNVYENCDRPAKLVDGLARCAEHGGADAEPSRRVTEQAPPVRNGLPAVWDLVIADMKARDAEGRRKYSVPLQPMNGRHALIDGYQEILDLAAYTRQTMEELKMLGDEMREIQATALAQGQHLVAFYMAELLKKYALLS
jgi:hypothetical protein